MNSFAIHPQPHQTRNFTARRGVALMMVLSVIAAASILAWAMLSASAMRSQIDANAVDAAEARSLAESGVSYAMHALNYPHKFRPAAADPVTWFWPGENGLKLWSDARGTVDVTVTSTGTDTRRIRATATVLRPGSTEGSKHTVEADVTNIYQGVVNAVGMNGNITLPGNVYINGAVVSKGTVNNQTNITGSPPIVPTGYDVAPLTTHVRLLQETGVTSTATGAGINDRTYTYNGNTYIAERVTTASIGALGLNTSRSAQNPLNVWYTNSSLTLNNASFTGVLVVRGGASLLSVSGINTLNAPAGMPALIVENKIDVKSTFLLGARLNVNGAVYVGSKIQASTPDKTDARINIDGALLWGDPNPAFNLSGRVDIKYKASAVKTLTDISTVKTIGSLRIDRWESVD